MSKAEKCEMKKVPSKSSVADLALKVHEEALKGQAKSHGVA
jgi:hypothetical protein